MSGVEFDPVDATLDNLPVRTMAEMGEGPHHRRDGRLGPHAASQRTRQRGATGIQPRMGPRRTIGFTPIAAILSDYLVEHRLRGAEGLVFGRDGSATIDDPP